jgi:ABC-type sugar transport system substrate-binding protein
MDGAARFQAKMALIPKAVITEVRKAMEEGAEEIVGYMKRLVPRDDGLLAASIGWTWGAAPAGSVAITSVGGPGGAIGTITIFAGDATTVVTNSRGKAFQNALIQEHGTKERAANPFFYPAYRALRSRVRSRITRSFKKAVRNV